MLKLGEFGDYQFDTLTQRRATASTIIERLQKLPNETRICVIDELLSEAGVDMPEKLAKELILSWEDMHQLSAAGISAATLFAYPNGDDLGPIRASLVYGVLTDRVMMLNL